MHAIITLLLFAGIKMHAQTPATHLNFDGVDDYVNITHFGRPENLTIEAWIKPTPNKD